MFCNKKIERQRHVYVFAYTNGVINQHLNILNNIYLDRVFEVQLTSEKVTF